MALGIEQMMKVLSKQLGVTETTTLGDVIKSKAEKVGDKVFLTFIRDFDNGIDEKYTYQDMHVLSNRLVNGLLKLGIKQRDGISFFQINSPEYLFMLFAAFIPAASVDSRSPHVKSTSRRLQMDFMLKVP